MLPLLALLVVGAELEPMELLERQGLAVWVGLLA
jgi:hypothetical protein